MIEYPQPHLFNKTEDILQNYEHPLRPFHLQRVLQTWLTRQHMYFKNNICIIIKDWQNIYSLDLLITLAFISNTHCLFNSRDKIDRALSNLIAAIQEAISTQDLIYQPL